MKGSMLYGKGNQANYGKAALKDYSVTKGSHDHPHGGALKQKATYIEDEGGDTKNERGRTQKQVLESRKKNLKKESKNLSKGSKKLQKAVNKGMNIDTAKEKQNELRKNLTSAKDRLSFSADSISQVNPGIIAQRKAQREIDAAQEYDRKNKKK